MRNHWVPWHDEEYMKSQEQANLTEPKMAARYDISQTIDGEWRTPPRKRFYRACCDCGLVHREEYRVRNGKVQYRVWRDVEETALERERLRGSNRE